jgi:hypothetical protein
MILHQLHKIPPNKTFTLACSGSGSSMAIADFYKRNDKKFVLAFFHCHTERDESILSHLRQWSINNSIRLQVGYLSEARPPSHYSLDQYHKIQRYKWLASFDRDIITCHHLGDVVEHYIYSLSQGNPIIMSSIDFAHYQVEVDGFSSYSVNTPIYRPFLLNDLKAFHDWCNRYSLSWFPSKAYDGRPSDRIRQDIIPQLLEINPDFVKVIRKQIK